MENTPPSNQFMDSNQGISENAEGRNWIVIQPPVRWKGASREAIEPFVINLLIPGFSIAFHAQVLKRTRASIRKYLRIAKAIESMDPSLVETVRRATERITASDGLFMAQIREHAHMPHWSRLAIAEMHKMGDTKIKLAQKFSCSVSTVNNVISGRSKPFHALTGARHRLTTYEPKWPTI